MGTKFDIIDNEVLYTLKYMHTYQHHQRIFYIHICTHINVHIYIYTHNAYIHTYKHASTLTQLLKEVFSSTHTWHNCYAHGLLGPKIIAENCPGGQVSLGYFVVLWCAPQQPEPCYLVKKLWFACFWSFAAAWECTLVHGKNVGRKNNLCCQWISCLLYLHDLVPSKFYTLEAF